MDYSAYYQSIAAAPNALEEHTIPMPSTPTSQSSQRSKPWRRFSLGGSSKKSPAPEPITSIRVITWNIDFMAANTSGRMVTALNYIQDDVLLEDEQDRCCILFQEVDHDAYRALCEHKWVRDKFVILPEDEELPHSYNVVTLVSKPIPVLRVQSLHFGNSTMGRSALLVDITLSVGKSSRSSWRKESSAVTCRIANTHLESLPTGVFARPYQLAAISSLLYQPGIHCGVVCGDMNTILPDDEDIHARAALADAWYGSSEEEGYTWGYQPACQFPPGRLDRVFYTHNRRCMVRSPKRIGMGLRTARGRWVSDHYGLLTTVSVL